MKKYFAFLAIVFVAALSLHADIYVKMNTHTDAMAIMGQNTPAKDTVVEQWIGDDKFASVSGDQAYVLDLKKNMGYIINNKSKTYVETPLPLDMTKLLPPEASAFAGMMKWTVAVTPTTETKKIGQWNCTAYDVNVTMMGMGMKMRVWASTDVPFDVNSFVTKIYANLVKGQMMMDDASVKEMMKIKGFQIASDMSGDIMGAKMHTTSEVAEISKKTPPAGVYAVPAGYTKTATLSMSDLQKK